MELDQLWQTTLSEIELQISRPNFLTWFKNSRLIEKKKDGEMIVGLANNFSKEWVRNKYHKIIFEILKNYDDSIKKIDYTVIENKVVFFNNVVDGFEKQLVIPELKIDQESGLHPRYKLDTFIVGSSNELAYAASLAVIKNIGKKYNPFFIYGGTGLGKTHLIQGIGNEIKKSYKNKVKVKYVHSEKFVNEVVTAIRNKRMEDLKNRYRNIDVLIIDDIQFIGGKERSEEEFFHTFNVLYENNKQIIFSSDKHPNYIHGLESRLKSRFGAGMIVDITAPEYESRIAIIHRKAQSSSFTMNEDCVAFIAESLECSIRELEGIINSIICQSRLKNRELLLNELKLLIKNNVIPKKTASVKDVIRIVSEFYNIEEATIYEKTRRKEIVKPRQIAMFILREDFQISFPTIGEKFGGRDHTTVIHSCEKIKENIKDDPNLIREIEQIRALL